MDTQGGGVKESVVVSVVLTGSDAEDASRKARQHSVYQ